MYSELCPNSWIQHVDRVWYDKPRDQLLVTNSVWASGFFALYFSKHWDKFPSVVNVRSTTEVRRLNSMNGKVHCNSNRFLIIREQPFEDSHKIDQSGNLWIEEEENLPEPGEKACRKLHFMEERSLSCCDIFENLNFTEVSFWYFKCAFRCWGMVCSFERSKLSAR